MNRLFGFLGALATTVALVLLTAKAAAVKAGSNSSPAAGKARVLLITGIDYPGHLWRQTAPALQDLLQKDPRLKVTVTEDPESLASLNAQDWDAIVLHFMNWEKPAPGEEARARLRKFVESGKGLMLVHFACGAWQDWPEFKSLAGRVWDPKLRGHDPHGKFTVEIGDPAHPIVSGMAPFATADELYTCLTGDAPIHPVATARSKVDGKTYPMAFVLEYGQGRVFHTVLGHDVHAITNSAVPELFRRGCAWAAGLPATPAPTE